MKSRLSFLPGSLLDHRGRECVVLDIIDLVTVLVRYVDTKEPCQVRVSELAQAKATDEKTPGKRATSIGVIRQGIDLISESQWASARIKFELLRPILETQKFSRTSKQFEKVAKSAGKSVSTIYQWVADYESTGLMSSLTRVPRSDRGKGRTNKAINKIIEHEIEGYLNENRPPVSDIYENVKSACKKKKIKPPGYSTVYRRVLAIPAMKRHAARQGSKSARDKYEPIKGSFPRQAGPLSTVQIDHSPVDIILVDSKHRLPVGGRATLTIATDVDTKMLVGFNLAYESPSAHMVGACLTHAVLPKEKFLMELGITNVEWPCWGLMKTLNTDNAAEFVGEAVGFGCREWNIELTQRPKGLPNYAGQVERQFRTFMKKVHTIPGTTFSNPQDRVEYDSTGKAIMTIEEFKRWFTIFVTKVYHQRGHKGIDGMSPIKKWEEGILGTDTKLGIGLPERVTDEMKFRVDFLPQELRTVQEYGIGLFNVTFWDEVLRPWVNAVDPTHLDSDDKRKFIVKYDPYLFNEVHFLDPELKQYFVIPTRDKTRPPVSLWEVQAATKRLREKGIASVNEDLIFEGIEEMREEVENASAKTKAARRQRERQTANKKYSVKKARDDLARKAQPARPLAPDEDDGPVAPRPGTVEPTLVIPPKQA
jgi:putative transposase